MRIQVTLHVKYKTKYEPTTHETASIHRLVEDWANRIAKFSSLPFYLEVEVIDVFKVGRDASYLNPSKESPF